MNGVDRKVHENGTVQPPGQIVRQPVADAGKGSENHIDQTAAEVGKAKQQSRNADTRRAGGDWREVTRRRGAFRR